MVLARQLIGAIRRDKSYLIAILITAFLILLMVSRPQWQTMDNSVPERWDSKLPNFGGFNSVSEKKGAFFDYLRPMVRQENMKIQYERAFLDKITQDFSSSTHHDGATLRKLRRLAKKYQVKLSGIESMIAELLLRVDQIPESLVLVQAANESAWGTSRFANQANNLFGQWCYTEGCGIIPKARNHGAKHEIRRFNTPQDSVVSYMRNLNSHNAFRKLREIRATVRENGQQLKGSRLAQGLGSYSEKGDVYIKELVAMIRHNRLE